MPRALELQTLSNKTIWRGLVRVQNKKVFPKTVIHKIFQTKSNLHVKFQGKNSFSVFEEIFISSDKVFISNLIVKNSHILAGIYFTFLKIGVTWKAFNTKFRPQWKDWESSYQVRQILVLFCKLVSLILGWNCVRVLELQKLSNKSNLKGSGDSSKQEIHIIFTIIHEIFEARSKFYVK